MSLERISKVQLTITIDYYEVNIGSGNGLALNRRKTVISCNDDQGNWGFCLSIDLRNIHKICFTMYHIQIN